LLRSRLCATQAAASASVIDARPANSAGLSSGVSVEKFQVPSRLPRPDCAASGTRVAAASATNVSMSRHLDAVAIIYQH
jgi:hypothetical protein